MRKILTFIAASLLAARLATAGPDIGNATAETLTLTSGANSIVLTPSGTGTATIGPGTAVMQDASGGVFLAGTTVFVTSLDAGVNYLNIDNANGIWMGNPVGSRIGVGTGGAFLWKSSNKLTLTPSASGIATLVPGTMATTAQLAAKEDAGPYAVIWIPLPPGSQWTDFELKASTNNFTNDGTGMVFYYHSPDPAKSSVPEQVWTNRPQVFFTDSGKTGTPNRRAWIAQSASQSIFAMLADASSEVGGFLIVVRDDLSAHRGHLVWSYTLLDGTSTDDDLASRSVWRPCWPTQWVTAAFDLNE